MNIKIVNAFCFLFPFVGSLFNLQAFALIYISRSVSKNLAYGFVGLLIIGIIINLKKVDGFSKTAGLWIIFYMFYYAFATLASVVHNNPISILASIIPAIYLLAFLVYLSTSENRLLFGKVALVSLAIFSLFSIYLFNINFHLEFRGISPYRIHRAGSVFGDANNTALVTILAFIFVHKKFNPRKTILKFLKPVLLLLIFYNLIITFSSTGYFIFVICFMLLNHKFFTPKRLIFVIIFLPVFYFTLFNLNELVSGLDLTFHQRAKVNNIVNMLTLNTSEVDSSGRDRLLDNLLTYVYKNPVIGNGVEFTNSVKGHNTIVGVWADAGVFTFLIFMLTLGNYFKSSIKSTPDIRFYVLPMLVCLCVFMLSLQSVITQPYLMAIFAYIGYVLDKNSSNLELNNPIENMTKLEIGKSN